MLGKVIFGMDDDFRLHLQNDALPAMIRLQRAVSYFGTSDSIQGLIHHVEDNELNTQILWMLWEERDAGYLPYKHFTTWSVDGEFKDLVRHLMDLDPKMRLTAQQALEHLWFSIND